MNGEPIIVMAMEDDSHSPGLFKKGRLWVMHYSPASVWDGHPVFKVVSFVDIWEHKRSCSIR